jgi:hypothetical protein
MASIKRGSHNTHSRSDRRKAKRGACAFIKAQRKAQSRSAKQEARYTLKDIMGAEYEYEPRAYLNDFHDEFEVVMNGKVIATTRCHISAERKGVSALVKAYLFKTEASVYEIEEALEGAGYDGKGEFDYEVRLKGA